MDHFIIRHLQKYKAKKEIKINRKKEEGKKDERKSKQAYSCRSAAFHLNMESAVSQKVHMNL